MFLGVDPGLTGALVVYDPDRAAVAAAYSVPTLILTRNGKTKGTVDLHRVIALTKELAARFPGLRAFLELVGPMPKQGVSSAWSFCRTDTALEAGVVAAGIPFTRVTPQKWKKALGCTADKDQTLLRASQLMPSSAHEWAPIRGQRDKEACKGLAEAGLIAYFGASQHLP